MPGTTNYENEQWNGGDLLAAFGVVNLGARVYDPVIGRFLSRDPILQASNPYVFAGNDPVNMSDPTGMLQTCYPFVIREMGLAAEIIKIRVGCCHISANPGLEIPSEITDSRKMAVPRARE